MICDNLTVSPSGHLLFAGQDTVELAKQYGTPLYLMDEDRIRHNCRVYTQAFRKHFGPGARPLYASKANSFKRIYEIMREEGMGIDVVSSGEIREGERFIGRSLMGSQYGVSSETIRRAMRHLSDMGIISVQNNVGSTVLSQKRAREYVEQYQEDKDLRALKAELREMLAQRDTLNEKINATVQRIIDLGERFWRSDRMRTYEFRVSDGPAAGQSIMRQNHRENKGKSAFS